MNIMNLNKIFNCFYNKSCVFNQKFKSGIFLPFPNPPYPLTSFNLCSIFAIARFLNSSSLKIFSPSFSSSSNSSPFKNYYFCTCLNLPNISGSSPSPLVTFAELANWLYLSWFSFSSRFFYFKDIGFIWYEMLLQPWFYNNASG